MYKKRMTLKRRAWHVVSVVVFIAAGITLVTGLSSDGNVPIEYLMLVGIVVLAALPGVFDSTVYPCTVCGGIGVIASGSWTLPCEANDCSHCKGTGLEPNVTSGFGPGW